MIPIAQREALLKAAESDEIMCPILTMLMLTGMRIGELLALQWKHIDFAAKTVSIQQSLTREIVFDEDGKTRQSSDALGTTKTRTSRRVIQVPDLVLERLRRWMKHVAGLKGGFKILVPDGFVFISTRSMKRHMLFDTESQHTYVSTDCYSRAIPYEVILICLPK